MYRVIRKLFCVFFVLTCLWIPQVQAQEPEYLQQDTGNSCTLCASTMMIRSLFHCAGSDAWQDISESDVRSRAWTSAGLSWNWSYGMGENTVTVGHTSAYGMTLEQVQSMLSLHPEGFALYCGGSRPHAVFITDEEDGIIYCADPAWGYAGARMQLSDSLLGKRHGDQGDILNAVTAYWYIADYTIAPSEPDRQVCPPEPPAQLLKNTPARL